MDQQDIRAEARPVVGPGDPTVVDAVVRLSGARSLEEVVQIVLEAARRLADADGVTFVLRDGEHCSYVEEQSIAPLWKGRRFPLTAGISGWTMLNDETAVVTDVMQDERIPHDLYRPTFVRSLVMVPVGETPFAAIGVYWAERREPDAITIAVLEVLARSAATALANAVHHQSLTRLVSEVSALYRLTDRLYRADSEADIYEAALEAICSALGCSRASILLFDDGGVMRFVAWRGLSDHYRAALEGHSPWKKGEMDPQPILVEDIEATDEAEHVKETIRAEGIRGLAFIPLLSRRAVVGKFMTYYEAPHAFSDGERDLAVTIARQLGFSLERMRAERQLREKSAQLEMVMQTVPAIVWIAHDPEARHITGSRYAADFLRLPETANQSLGARSADEPKPFRILKDGSEVAVEDLPVQRAARGEEVRDEELEVAFADGTTRWEIVNASPVHDASGQPIGAVGAGIDITERKRAEWTRSLLVDELNHRVRNTLAVVQGIAHQTFRGGAAQPEALDAFEGRIAALSAAHDLLTRANWESASLDQLAAEALRAGGANEQRVTIGGPAVRLRPREAVTLAMALHELCTNAIKYGALSDHAGEVALEWRTCGGSEPRLTLEWREHGGPPVSPPKHRGFGSRMIEQALAHELDGAVSVQFRPEGLVCSIEAPLSGIRKKRDIRT